MKSDTRAKDGIGWGMKFKLEKYWDGQAVPYETINGESNTLMNAGAGQMWQRLITLSPSTSSTGAAAQAFSTKSALGVGASTASTGVRTLTDLASTAKLRQPMEATFPSNTTGTSTSARSIQMKSAFGTTQANFAWKEWAVFNSTASGTMLNRKVQDLGTKTTAATWNLTVTLSLS